MHRTDVRFTLVNGTRGDAQYLAGYDAGRTLCVRSGSVGDALQWIEAHQEVDSAYLAGFEWAVWDYEHANGAPHDRRAAGG